MNKCKYRAWHGAAIVMLPLSVLAMMFAASPAAAKPAGVKAAYDAKSALLKVTVKTQDSEVVLYDDVLDQELSRTPQSANGAKLFVLDHLPVVPCRVRVESGGKSAIKPTKGADCKGLNKPISCRITSPNGPQSVQFGNSLSFTGQVKGAKTRHMNYEWDFGGNADTRPTSANTGPVVFNVRDNARFWVTFSAADLTGTRCADRVQITVGNTPAAPAKVAEEPPLAGDGNHAVVPFQPFGMAFHDLSYGYYSMVAPSNWLNAMVIRKGGVDTDKPLILTPNEAGAKFSAASSPTDPVGNGSINSTSQNYPLGKTYGEADIKKSDWFDPCRVWKHPNANSTNVSDTQFTSFFEVYLKQKPAENRVLEPRPGTGVVAGVSGNLTNAECVYSNYFFPNWYAGDMADFDPNNPASWSYSLLKPDEGAAFWSYEMLNVYEGYQPGDPEFTGLRGVIPANGSAMPGRDGPYQTNSPQSFSNEPQKETGDNYPGFDAERKFFAAKGMPQFPTDDQGRHNAYPLMRIQAHDKSGKLLATADAVTAVTTEMKCAECHTKGKNGADQSVFDGLKADMAKLNDTDPSNDIEKLKQFKGREKWIPVFVSPEELDPNRPNDRDVIEQASMINIARLHDFYYNFIEDSGWLGPLEFESEQLYGKAGEVRVQPGNCTDYCHKTVPRADPRRYNMNPVDDIGNACPEMSDSLHNIHGRLTGSMNPDYTGSIDRDPITRELKLVDVAKLDPAKPPQFLLTVKDAGTPDDSCYFCHAGKQDKYQRDVMSAAGVNCIDCHGDLAVLAGGGAMVSRGTGDQDALLDSRADPTVRDEILNKPIDKDKLASAFSSEESSYGDERDGTYYYMEKGADGLYRHTKKDGQVMVVTTLEMALNFLSGTTGVTNPDGTYTLTKKVEGQPDEVSTLSEAQLLESVKVSVNGWNLKFGRIPWVEQLSCANCHTGHGDEPVRRRAYDMTTGKFKLLPVTNERFAENLQPKKHDSSYTLLVQDGQNCPPGTFSGTVTQGGQHVCERGLFKDSVDRHGKVPCEACHGATHAVWPNPNPYANDNVTALQLQGHTGTLLECNVCHEKNGSKDVFFAAGLDQPKVMELMVKGPHDMHPVADPRFVLNDNADSSAAHSVSHREVARANNAARENGGTDICGTCHGADHKGSRLAKTPIDRVLTMADPKRKDLKPGTKKQVKVKKGDIIGCDLCHSLEMSFNK